MAQKKHLVFFGRPTPRMIGKDKQTPSNDSIWMSKCGKFKIESKEWAGSRNGCWVRGYRLTELGTGKVTDHDTFADARFEADLYTVSIRRKKVQRLVKKVLDYWK